MSRPKQSSEIKAFGQSVGSQLGAHRLGLAWSGGDLASASGVSLDAIRSIEAGRVASPGLFAVYRLSTALGLSLDAVARRAATDAEASDPAPNASIEGNPPTLHENRDSGATDSEHSGRDVDPGSGNR